MTDKEIEDLKATLVILEKENKLLRKNVKKLFKDLNVILNSKSYKIAHGFSKLSRKILGRK
jgi:hypothetical protein